MLGQFNDGYALSVAYFQSAEKTSTSFTIYSSCFTSLRFFDRIRVYIYIYKVHSQLPFASTYLQAILHAGNLTSSNFSGKTHDFCFNFLPHFRVKLGNAYMYSLRVIIIHPANLKDICLSTTYLVVTSVYDCCRKESISLYLSCAP